MLDSFRKIHALLSGDERRKAMLLFAMMIVMGVLEVIGVSSIMPFIGVLSNPELVETNKYLNTVYVWLQFSDKQQFFLFLGAVTFGLVVGSLAFKACTLWVMARFTQGRNYSFSARLLRGYLRRPYSWFLYRHSSELGKFVLSEVNQVVTRTLMPALQLVANVIVALFLLALVISVEPLVAMAAVVILGGAYGVIYGGLRSHLGRIGADRVAANRERFRVAQEAFNAIKEVKIHRLEERYIKAFERPASRFARRQASSQIASEIPKFALRGLAFGGILVILLILLESRGGNLSAILPVMALYAFAGSRLLPALQEIYKALTALRFGKPALDSLYEEFREVGVEEPAAVASANLGGTGRLALREGLELVGVTYAFQGAQGAALRDINLRIKSRTTVALVGSTGAGKTTLVDVIMGLLLPSFGEVRVDGQTVTGENLAGWQRNIGYVPQQIFLADDTVAGNIAFGIPEQHVDHEAVEAAARVAELHRFIVEELPDGYQTYVGEQGIRLSGGQRQRFGIARALYHDPDVLVLDEATSALDTLTEKAVMDAIHNLGHRKTIIIIAHRISTVRRCDSICLLDHGMIAGHATYDDLMENNQLFRRLASEPSLGALNEHPGETECPR